MIWVRLSGGLGNQLFQWAAAEELRGKTHQDIQFYTRDLKNYAVSRDFLINKLVGDFYLTGCPSRITSFFLRYRLTKVIPAFFPWNIHKNNISTLPHRSWFVLDDYFQNTILIKIGMQLVAAKIAESTFRNDKVTAFFEKLLEGRQNNEVAALHIRRSDYLSQKNRKIFYLLGNEYYSHALERLDDGIKQIFIFTDGNKEDIPIFGDWKVIYVKTFGFSDLEEFVLLSLFHSIIIANSTYSFWAALVSNKDKRRKIGPFHWLLNNNRNKVWNNNLLNAGFIIV